jgi:two-component system chemotaxis family response regulator WspR
MADSVGTSQFEAHGHTVQAIRAEARNCANEGACLAILAIGLDRYTEIAASAGEDAAEKMFGQLLRAVQVHCGRDRDHVLRMANDTIIAVCPKTLPAGAHNIASQIRESTEQMPSLADGSHVTLSIGISTAAPGGEDAAEGLLSRAERSLEAARESGGGRIIGAAPASQPPAPSSLRSLAASILPTKRAASARRQGD